MLSAEKNVAAAVEELGCPRLPTGSRDVDDGRPSRFGRKAGHLVDRSERISMAYWIMLCIVSCFSAKEDHNKHRRQSRRQRQAQATAANESVRHSTVCAVGAYVLNSVLHVTLWYTCTWLRHAYVLQFYTSLYRSRYRYGTQQGYAIKFRLRSNKDKPSRLLSTTNPMRLALVDYDSTVSVCLVWFGLLLVVVAFPLLCFVLSVCVHDALTVGLSVFLVVIFA